MQLPARHATECQPHRRRREPGRTLPELPEGTHTWILDFWPQNDERIRFCCLKPPSLRCVVMAATGNEYRALWAGNSQSTRADQTHFPPGPVSSHGFLPRTLPEAHWTMARLQKLAISCSRWSDCTEWHTCLSRLISEGKPTGNNTGLELGAADMRAAVHGGAGPDTCD